MAEVPRSLLDDLSTEVGRLSLTAKTQVATILDQVIAAWDGTAPADLRNAVIQVFQTVMPTYTDLAAALASDFYDTVRQLQNAVGTYRSTVWSGHSVEADEGAIRGILDSVIKDGDTGRFRSDLLNRVDAEIRKSANRCVDYNSKRDPARPSWALVPSNAETCGFCLSIAAFGFRYDQPVHGHGNCDCRAVARFGGGTVEGYDPDGMYERYQECLDALGGRDGIGGDWRALSEEERAAYIQRHGGNGSEAFGAYVQSRIVAEIESRDPGWFTANYIPEVALEAGADPLQKERVCASWLASRGLNVTFRKTREAEHKKTSDIYIGETPWEIKQPNGTGDNNINNQFNEAKGQSTRLVIDASISPFGFDGVVERATVALTNRNDFDEVIIIDGQNMRRIIKAR